MRSLTIKPPFGWLANTAMVRSVSDVLSILIGPTSTPSDGATDWITAYWPIPAGIVGSQRIAARVTLGAICLRSSTHLPLKLYSNCIKPEAFLPGCARLATKPEPTGSGTIVKMIGTVRVACSRRCVEKLPVARMTSGESATSSAAYLRLRTGSAAPKRASIRRLRPSIQPSCCNPCRDASYIDLMSASSAAPKKKPTRRTRSDCCARAASGQAAATPPRRVMTSRRRIATPETEERAIVTIKSIAQEGVMMSALGQKQTCAVHSPVSALPPNATSNATYGMSALGQKSRHSFVRAPGLVEYLNFPASNVVGY